MTEYTKCRLWLNKQNVVYNLRGVAAVYLTENIFMATPMLLSQPNSFVIRIITHLWPSRFIIGTQWFDPRCGKLFLFFFSFFYFTLVFFLELFCPVVYINKFKAFNHKLQNMPKSVNKSLLWRIKVEFDTVWSYVCD